MVEAGYGDLAAANRRRSVALLASVSAVPVVVLALLGALVGRPVAAAAVGAVVTGIAVWLAVRSAEARLLRSVGARPADEAEFARLYNLVDGLCVAAGLPNPHLYVVDDPGPDALAAGVEPGRSVLVVTSGLVTELDRVELEGVIAHELAHVKTGDTRFATLALALLGPFAARLLSPRRELAADLNGVALTRYPPGLAAALTKVDEADGPRRPGPLWLASDAPRLAERVAALREL